MAVRLPYNTEALQQAVSLLKQGELVAFPTETVYGLGADASNPEAIQKIFTIKSRPKQQALSVLISEITDLHYWAQSIPPETLRLAEAFWPGPLTLIVPAAPHVASEITAGTGNIGLRLSSHSVVQALLKALGRAIVAPSANLTGHLSPTQALHVDQQLGAYIPLILEGDASLLGWESTLVDLTTDIPTIRREGVITQSQIQALCPNVKVLSSKSFVLSNANRALPKPDFCSDSRRLTDEEQSLLGVNEYHRQSNNKEAGKEAPFRRSSIQLMTYSELVTQVTALCNASKRIAVLAYHSPEVKLDAHVLWITMPTNVTEYQRVFYAQLHWLKQQGYSSIWIESPPQESAWTSVHAKLDQMCHG